MKKHLSGFKKFLITYTVLLVLLIAAGLTYVWFLLIDYEAGMPDVNMEKHLAEFDGDHIDKMLDKYPPKISMYDSFDSVVNAYRDMISGKEITYRKYTGRYTNATPVYEVMAGDEAVACVTLSEEGRNKHGFPIWTVSQVEFDGYGPERDNITIRVPDDAIVTINGIQVSRDDIAEAETMEELLNVTEYLKNVREYKIYEIKDIIKNPEIVVTSNLHKIRKEENDSYTISYVYDTDKEIPDELYNRVISMGRAYGAYIINKGSLSELRSHMIGKAREYVSNIPAIWAYLWSEQYTYNFTDEKIENYISYDEDCFSCDVSYKLNVFYRATRSISYDTHIHCVYIKVEGVWYLADFALSDE